MFGGVGGVESHFLGWCSQRTHLHRDVLRIWQPAPGHSCCSESQPSGLSPAWGLEDKEQVMPVPSACPDPVACAVHPSSN